MKLYMKQKVFSWGDHFTVKDQFGEDRYIVQGEFFSLGKRLHIYDPGNTEIATIQQRLMAFFPRYAVLVDGNQVAEINQKFSFLKPRYQIEGLGWEIEGDFWAHDYQISQNGELIMTIQKEWMTWGDCYALDILQDRDELLAVTVALAIDCAVAQQASH